MKLTVLWNMETTHTSRAGVWSVVLGLLAHVGLAWVWALSVGMGLDVPDAVRDGLALLLPAGVIGALAGGIHAYPGAGRRLAVAGISLAAAAVVGFLVLLLVGG